MNLFAAVDRLTYAISILPPATPATVTRNATFSATRTPQDPQDKIDPALRTAFQARTLSPVTYLVYMTAQLDLSAADTMPDWSRRGEYVVNTLKTGADSAQRALIADLDARSVPYRQFWITNALAVTSDEAQMLSIAQYPEVYRLDAIKMHQLGETHTLPGAGNIASAQPHPASSPQRATVEWNIAQIGADDAWSTLDADGSTIVVANIDSGVRYTRETLRDAYRGNQQTPTNHDYSWFDPDGLTSPVDDVGHGTHTMGTIVGSDGATNQIGVAPRAQWIAADGCDGSGCSSLDLIAAAQWMLAPTR
ncbi:MAG: S8 family serine peptidase [Caldilineaceae bacterium]|nr:S8 family serine peptidase [Caldilineaceae bacterium]